MPTSVHPRDLNPTVRHHQWATTVTWDLGSVRTPWGPAQTADIQTVLTAAWHPSMHRYVATLHRQHLFTLDGQDSTWRDVSTTTKIGVLPAARFGPRVLAQFLEECLDQVTYDLPGGWFTIAADPEQGELPLVRP